MSVRTLVLSGDGVNCERESAAAFARCGSTSKIVHINSFLRQTEILKDTDILVLPGGFSFGDEVRSGVILARKLEQAFGQKLKDFVDNGGLVLGICNGFQVLVQLGVFGKVTLAKNRQGIFMDSWTKLDILSTNSPWLQNLHGHELALPVRHGEGRLIVEDESKFQVALKYRQDINGSFDQCAGIVDCSGRILGLMPHPEAALDTWLHPFEEGKDENVQTVKKIFENAIQYSRSQK